MACHPEKDAFRLSITGGNSGAWACIGMRLLSDVLKQGRYLALMIESESEQPVTVSPCLRYRLPASRTRDIGPATPVVLPPARQANLCHLPIEEALLGESRDCELNVYFETDQANLKVVRLEPLLVR